MQYTDEPFGNTTLSGSDTIAYTGREMDATGPCLYFYRARYYAPILQRFVSEDPSRELSRRQIF
jgi:RHS repeat-associated protein